MEWLNYHHLLYFWTVAKRGSVVAACDELKLRQPTISAQIQALEESIGEKLFDRTGRKLVLTETGKTVYKYAEQIFMLGRELTDVMKGRPVDHVHQLVVGINEVVPKSVAYRLLKIAFELPEQVHLVCKEDSAERLIADLAIHNVDMVISDSPLVSSALVKGYSHLLGECGVSFLAVEKLAAKYKKQFPKSLEGAPMLLPLEHSSLRGQIESYFQSQDITPKVVAEFADSALLKLFGAEGHGVFVVPTAIEAEVQSNYGVDLIGRVSTIRERFYLITASRKIKNPVVQSITEAAKDILKD
jgi:LysR family transcriptional activator of nhaA